MIAPVPGFLEKSSLCRYFKQFEPGHIFTLIDNSDGITGPYKHSLE